MSDLTVLTTRIDAEFKQLTDRVKQAQEAELQEFHAREQRLAEFGKQLDIHKGLWISRLEILAARFKDHVKITPSVSPAARSATFEFQSPLAKISLKFSVGTDQPVKTVIFTYDLEIIPVLMQFENHATIEFPFGELDEETFVDEAAGTAGRARATKGKRAEAKVADEAEAAPSKTGRVHYGFREGFETKLAGWLDDRIVDFVKTYISVHENDYYLKDHMVEDPITRSRFAKFAAAAQLEWNKETYYFVSEETKQQFGREKGIRF